MITAPLASTNPHPGVMTTSPPTAPEQKPSTLGLPRNNHSNPAQLKVATAVAKVVVINELAAIPSAPRALQALNTYQPTESIPVLSMQGTIECGSIMSVR